MTTADKVITGIFYVGGWVICIALESTTAMNFIAYSAGFIGSQIVLRNIRHHILQR